MDTENSKIPPSREVIEDEWWRSGAAFHWTWPKFDMTRPADRRTRAGLNRYPHNVIGAYVILFGRGWGVRWKGSQRRRRGHADA